MATFNLIRNSKLLFSTNVDATTGVFTQGIACTAANTFQIPVLDGFTFSQSTTADSITLAEAGAEANRGSRSFNTTLNPVEFSFSTYIRPYLNTTIKSDDSVLWNALMSDVALSATPVNFAYTTHTSSIVSATGLLTVTGTGFSTTANLTIGKVYILSGFTGVNANKYNAAVRLVSVTGTTIFTAQYLTAPPAATITSQMPVTTVLKFNEAAWVENTAQAGDTGFTTAYTEASTVRSNLNRLQKFALIVTVDQVTYAIDNCVLDQATIDFGLDGIAMVAWTGKGSAIRQMTDNTVYGSPLGGTIGGYGGTMVMTATSGVNGITTAASTSTKYITNKLSTVALSSFIGGVGGISSSVGYTLAITGGSITIANNVTYVTPNNLGVVNSAINYFTGSRSVSGSLTAYLRTGNATGSGTSGNSTATLLNDMLASSAVSAETKFALTLAIGGSTNTLRVELYSPGAALQIPTIDAQAVMSTTINFNAQGTDSVVGLSSANYDIENTNDLRIRYFSPA